MPQSVIQKVVNSFNAGLVTEFSELKFPENASVDELNCDLSKDGSRARRLGLEVESDYALSSFQVKTNKVFQTFTWLNAGGLSGYNLVVIQVGGNLYFYEANKTPFSAQDTGLTFDLSTYGIAGYEIAQNKCQCTSIGGVLVVASAALDTFYLVLDTNTMSLSSHKILFRVRDFDYQSDLQDMSERVSESSVTRERKYDTKNAGWTGVYGSSALDTYIANRSAWPPLTHAWYSGKDSSGNFSLTEWEKVFAGTSIFGNGHFILDFFYKDRSDASGISGIDIEIEPNRFKSVTSYAGRVWYAGLGSGINSGRILYSRIIESIKVEGDNSAIGDCFQQNDPTSEDFSDLLDTDGGSMIIPEAFNIKKVFAADQYLYVFAENGVWVVGGVQSSNSNTARFVSRNFSASGYFVSKITSVGLDCVESFVSVEGVPFWWSKYGIHTFSYDQSTGMPVEQNLTVDTIQTFWDSITTEGKRTVTSAYDPKEKKVYWTYKSATDTEKNKYSKVLILDIPLKAFYPWQISNSSDYYVMLLHTMEGYFVPTANIQVVNSDDVDVVNSSGVEVVSDANVSVGNEDTVVVAYVLNVASKKMTIATFSSLLFRDFTSENFQSYAIAAYDFLGDAERRKTAPYVTVYCRSTEQGFTGTEVAGYDSINESSLLVSALWDFKETAYSTQQAYRIKPFPVVDSTDLTNNQQDRSVVATRLKIRGKGRSCRFKFESEEGKNFVLIGYSIIAGINNGF